MRTSRRSPGSSGLSFAGIAAGALFLAACGGDDLLPAPATPFGQSAPEPLSPGASSAQQTPSWTLEGTGHNLAVDKKAGVKFSIYSGDKGSYYAAGAFDNVNLFGDFHLYGRQLPICEPGDVCLQFTGAIAMDGKGGWPKGTQTTCVMTLVLSPQNGTAVGTYHLGPLPSIDFGQYGLLALSLE